MITRSKTTTNTINLSLPVDLLNSADRVAKKEMRSRSELMREALRQYVDREESWETLCAYTQEHFRRLGITPEDVEEEIRAVRRGA